MKEDATATEEITTEETATEETASLRDMSKR
jgi:hypothetical protein